MARWSATEAAILDVLDDPALIVRGRIIVAANDPARAVFGAGVEGHDVRLAIRHPHALESILAHHSGEVELSGIGEVGRAWRLVIRRLDADSVLVRLVDRSEAAATEKMRVDFVANASHELRTPLTTVLGYAETLAEDGDLPPELRSKFSGIIRDEAARMGRIIEDLMSLSRIEADRFVAPGERVDIGEVVGLAVETARKMKGADRCTFAIEVPDGLPAARGDRAQLMQLLDNLLGNAVRYGCDSPDPRIEVSVASSGEWIAISVADHGPGIPREHLPRVTQRFYRVDAGRSRESGGTGLGLAIVKHIVERHRGLLEIKSRVGEGTRVTVRLPAAD